MKASSLLAALSFSATLTSAQQWFDQLTSVGAWTAWDDPNVWGPCAISCFKTASLSMPTATSDWEDYCVTPLPNPLVSCLSSSCSAAAAAPWSAVTAAESSLCSAYSSCSSLYSFASSSQLPAACAVWPWLGPNGGNSGPGHYWPNNWIGTSGCSYFTATPTSGPTTGWTTTTATVVETTTGQSGTSVVTTTTVISATIARADVAEQTSSPTGPATTTASPTSGGGSGAGSGSSAPSSRATTNAAAAVGGVNAMGIIVALTLGIIVHL